MTLAIIFLCGFAIGFAIRELIEIIKYAIRRK